MAIECTASGVASPAECFTCLAEKQLLGMEVYLLAQIALASNPGMDITPAAIASNSNCYTSCLSGKGLLGAAVYLLCQITNGGGGGGGGGTQQVYFGASPPAAPADPTKAALFYPTGGGAIKQWNGAAWV